MAAFLQSFSRTSRDSEPSSWLPPPPVSFERQGTDDEGEGFHLPPPPMDSRSAEPGAYADVPPLPRGVFPLGSPALSREIGKPQDGAAGFGMAPTFGSAPSKPAELHMSTDGRLPTPVSSRGGFSRDMPAQAASREPPTEPHSREAPAQLTASREVRHGMSTLSIPTENAGSMLDRGLDASDGAGPGPGGFRKYANSAEVKQPAPQTFVPASPQAQSLYSQHSSGDAAGGTVPRERDIEWFDEPKAIGKSAAHGAGVGSLSDSIAAPLPWVGPPADAAFLSEDRKNVLGNVSISDGFGSTFTLEPNSQKFFEVSLDVGGALHWKNGERSETLQPPPKTNWIVASLPADGREVTCMFYTRTYGLPEGATHLSRATVILVGSGPVVVWNGYGEEISIERGADKAFPVRLDAQGFFRWRCDAKEERTRAPTKEVNWIRAVHPSEGREITWRFYSTGAANSQPASRSASPEKQARHAPPAELSADVEEPRSGASAHDDGRKKYKRDDDGEEEYEKSGCFSCTFRDFPFCSAHCPCFFATVVLVLVFGCLGAAWPGIQIETDFDSFLSADSRANEVRRAFMAALDSRGNSGRRLSSAHDRNLAFAGTGSFYALDPSLLHRICRLEIMYESREGDNLISMSVLSQIRAFEEKLRSGKLWKKMCKELGNFDLSLLCEPGISLMNLVWPVNMDAKAKYQTFEMVKYNLSGRGREPLPMEAVFQLSDRLNIRHALFPDTYTGSGASSQLRTLFEFDLVVCTVHDSMSYRKQQLAKLSKEYDAFIAEELYPALLKQSEDEEASFDVYWRGTSLDSHEVWETLKNDCMFAIGSVIFIFLYLSCHTSSPLISAYSLFLAVLSIPAAFITAARLSGGNVVTGAHFLSLFLIVGLGADVVLVFVSFFAHSREEFGTNYSQRLLFTYRHAGYACLATTLTTAASFFANLASVLKPLREFGFFMGLCIVDVYCLVLVGLPPVLIANEKLMDSITRRTGIDFSNMFGSGGNRGIDEKPGSVASFLSMLYVEHFLVPYRRIILAVFMLAPIVMIIWTGSVVSVDGDMPQMFPEKHNLNKGKKLASNYVKIDEMWLDPVIHICNMDRSFPSLLEANTHQGCALTWCNIGVGGANRMITHGYIRDEGSECVCMPNLELPANAKCWDNADNTLTRQDVTIGSSIRFVGLPNVPDSFWSSDEWISYIQKSTQQANNAQLKFGRTRHQRGTYMNVSTMVQEHWESGEIRVATYSLAPAMSIEIPKTSPPSPKSPGKYCAANEICYCGAPACKFRDESLLGQGIPKSKWNVLRVPPARGGRRLASGSQPSLSEHQAMATLQQHTAGHTARAAARRLEVSEMGEVLPSTGFVPQFDGAHGRRLGRSMEVSVVWGLEVDPGTPLLGKTPEKPWEFAPGFRPDGPRAQRHLYSACMQFKRDPELLVMSDICWIAEFRGWLWSRNELWPTRATRFRSLLAGFQATGLLSSGIAVTDYMWFGSDGGLKATYISFQAAMSYDTTPAAAALRYMKKWEDAMKGINDKAPMDAKDGWHTSRLWIRAEAETAIVDSTVATLMVSISCGFLGTFAFTHLDLMLSGFVVLAVTGVTCCLAFFMTVMMGWAFGAVEVLGLIVFVGYSITYSLHIAHKYGERTKELDADRASISVQRRQGTAFAMEQMAGAVAGSAVTTLGSSFFLFFCAMAIFGKLASVLFAVTFFACIFALAALPSALLVVGPIGQCGCGACGAWLRGEDFGDAEEPGVKESFGSAADFDLARETGSSSPSHAGRDQRGPGEINAAHQSRRSEVFLSTAATPTSSPGIRSLVASAPPGPPLITGSAGAQSHLPDVAPPAGGHARSGDTAFRHPAPQEWVPRPSGPARERQDARAE